MKKRMRILARINKRLVFKYHSVRTDKTGFERQVQNL